MLRKIAKNLFPTDKSQYWADGAQNHPIENYENTRQTWFTRFLFDYFILYTDTYKFDKKKLKILEVGCNTGKNLNYLKNKGFTNLTGIDINQEAINYGKELRGDYIKFKQGDCRSLLDDMNDNSFDFVYSIGCLININNYMKVAKNMTRISSNLVMFKEKKIQLRFNKDWMLVNKTNQPDNDSSNLRYYKWSQADSNR